MTLQVIGAGWGRTGTMSLKLALEQLGYPCHHMHEVFLHPEVVPLFTAAARGEPDWAAIYGDYTAAVDWPTCSFWRELSAEYPDAKVILTERDPQDWYESFTATIQKPITTFDGEWGDMVRAVIIERDLEGDPNSPDHLQAVFARHNDEVRATIAAERLLEFRVSEGWEPLCEFLDRAVPDEPFPRVNDREEFVKRLS